MRKVWWIFIISVVGLALWFAVNSGLAVCSYFSYSVQVPISIKNWSIEERKANQFAILADYIYQYKEKEYKATSSLGGFYPNPWAAQLAKDQYAQKEWQAWIKPKEPSKSVLEKRFPYKKAVSAAILAILVIYFICLGTYVRIKHGR